MSTIDASPHGEAHTEAASALPRYAMRNCRLPAKLFHWVTAGLVFFMVASGVTMTQLAGGPVADTLFTVHKTTGVCVLILVLSRLAYRIFWPETLQRNEKYRRATLHWILYAAVILMPLLGWAGVSDYNSLGVLFGYTLPAIWPRNAGYGQLLLDIHAYLAFSMLALVALHIAVAMQDHMMRSRDPSQPEE